MAGKTDNELLTEIAKTLDDIARGIGDLNDKIGMAPNWIDTMNEVKKLLADLPTEIARESGP